MLCTLLSIYFPHLRLCIYRYVYPGYYHHLFLNKLSLR